MYYIYGLFKEGSSNLEDLYYIGITCDLKSRIKKHVLAKGHNNLKNNYINKYGCSMFVFWQVECSEEASNREIFLINWFGRICDGSGQLTNIINYKMNPDMAKGLASKDTRERMSKSAIKRSKNPEYKQKQRDSQLSMPIEEIHEILESWRMHDRWELQEFLKPFGIKTNCFKWWVKKYRPDLIDEVENKKIRMYNRFLESGMSKTDFAKKYNMHRKTLTSWEKKYERFTLS